MVDFLTSLPTKIRLGLGMLAIASVCSASGGSIATVTSGEPFTVDGVTLSNPGVSSWPLISSDEIATSASAALLKFRDGSAVKLAPQSRIKLAGSESAPEVIVIAGNIETKIAPGSRLLVTRALADDGQDTGANTPAVQPVTGAARPNNNNTSRKTAFLYTSSFGAIGGLGLAVDAILQPTVVSTR